VLILAVAASTTLIIAYGAGKLEVQDSWIANFDQSSELINADKWFNDQFVGSNVLNVIIDAGYPLGSYSPTFIASIDRLLHELSKMDEVGGSLSLVNQFETVAQAVDGRPRLPDSPEEAAQWALILESAGGELALAPYVNRDASAVNLWVFLNHAEYRRTQNVIQQAKAVLGQSQIGASPVSFAGDASLG
jgi:predicted RND superfamily exporter protein